MVDIGFGEHHTDLFVGHERRDKESAVHQEASLDGGSIGVQGAHLERLQRDAMTGRLDVVARSERDDVGGCPGRACDADEHHRDSHVSDVHTPPRSIQANARRRRGHRT